jgi:peroxiredoxin/outer membrane lipoprotein-sorting protein
MNAFDPARNLLKIAEEKLLGLSGLTTVVTGQRTWNDPDPKRRSHATFTGTLQLLRPNLAQVRYRSGRREVVVIADGQARWQWERGERTYHRGAVGPSGQSIDVLDSLPVGWPVAAFFQGKFPHLDTTPTLSREGRFEVVTFEDAPQARQKFYIGTDGLVHKFVNEQQNGRYLGIWELKNIRMNPELRPAQFVFTPPPGTTLYAPSPRPELLKVGALAPDFTLPDESDQPVSLSSLRGKVVVLDFWAASCGPCLEAFPHNEAVAKKLGANVVFLAIHGGDTKANFAHWRKKNPSFPSLRFVIDTAPSGQDVGTRLYKIFAQPTAYIIGKDGRIAKVFIGYEGPTSMLEDTIAAEIRK